MQLPTMATGPLPQKTCSYLADTGALPSYPPVNPPLLLGLNKIHTKQHQKQGSVEVAPKQVRTAPELLLPQGERKIITSTPAVGCGQTSDLTIGAAKQQKFLRTQHRERALRFHVVHLWQMSGLTQPKTKAAPEWPSKNRDQTLPITGKRA